MESNVQRKMQSLIRKNGGYVFKNNGNLFTEPGRPDLVACLQGRFIGIEVKDKGKLKQVSEAQKIVGQEIINAGGLWFSLDNVDDLEKILVEHFRGLYGDVKL